MNEEKVAITFLKTQFNLEMYDSLVRGAQGDLEVLINYAIYKAWNDAVIYEKKNKGSRIIKNKPQICNLLKRKIYLLENCNDYRGWLRGTLKFMSDECFEKKFGISQKFVNMSIKYLYIIEKGLGIRLFPQISFIRFEKDLDVPIDSFILKWFIYNSIGDEQLREHAEEIASWNKMTSNIYTFLQEKIKVLLNERYEDVDTVLIAETLVWKDIKILKKSIKMEI